MRGHLTEHPVSRGLSQLASAVYTSHGPEAGLISRWMISPFHIPAAQML